MSDAAERGDIHIRAVVWAAVAIGFTIMLALLIAYLMWTRLRPAESEGGPNTAFNFKVASPRLESAPQPERADYFAEKERLLHSWQWIDQKAGIARIPMGAAMQLMVQGSANNATGTEKRK
ncbi:MAG TPA: hypothetical protein VIF82_08030 [Burkholderiaceae bacterium]|jgi:hypothetical protein